MTIMPKRSLKYGSVSIVLIFLVVIVVILLNIFFDALGERYELWFDLTKNQIFKLSDASVQFLENLEEDVILYILSKEENLTTWGRYFVQVHEVLRQYDARSPHLVVEYIDLPSNPGFARRFPQYDLSWQLIILESGGRNATIQITDLFNTEYEQLSGTEYIVSSKAEQTLSSAIIGVTSDIQSTVSFLEGFGESDGIGLASVLALNNYKIVRQNILTEEVEQTATIAVICAPIHDYSEDELKKLERFLRNDDSYGRSLLYFASAIQPPMPNLNAFLAEWGISVGDGLIYQTDTSKVLSMNHYYSLAEYNETVLARTAIDRRLYTVVPMARPLSLYYTPMETVEITVPLYFADTAVVAPFNADEDWMPQTTDTNEPIPAFIMSTGAPYTHNADVNSSVLVFSSYEIISESALSSMAVGNSEYMLNTFGALTNQEDPLFIAPKTIGSEELPITSNIISGLALTFVALLPLSVLLTGGFIYYRRRRL